MTFLSNVGANSTMLNCTFLNYLIPVFCFVFFSTLELLHEQPHAVIFECAMCTIFDSAASFTVMTVFYIGCLCEGCTAGRGCLTVPGSGRCCLPHLWGGLKSGLVQDARI